MRMINIRYIIIICLLLITPLVHSSIVENDSSKVIVNEEKYFINEGLLDNFFLKLSNLQSSRQGKINIVQIGDSHIQAGFIGQIIRQVMQDTFGDGGYGFSFPYELIKTNGPRNVRYVTNVPWNNYSNTKSISDVKIGIGGFALTTSSKNFVLQLYGGDLNYNKIKVIYPTLEPQFRLSTATEPLKVNSVASSVQKLHKIRSGESLSTIAHKYGVSILQIRKANKISNNRIYAGKILKIPSKNTIQISNVRVDNNVEFTTMQDSIYYSVYSAPNKLDRLTFFPIQKKNLSNYTINGFVLENDNHGIIFHSIGVNGAHISDYSKYPLFFNQLSILNPDLIIISLGTNESFARMDTNEYINQMNEFISNIKECSKNAIVLITTPSPSMIRRSRTNTYVKSYALALTSQSKYPVWDLYMHMDGSAGIKTGRFASMIGRDKIHYSQKGYELQGHMFVSDLLNAYKNYKNNIKE